MNRVQGVLDPQHIRSGQERKGEAAIGNSASNISFYIEFDASYVRHFSRSRFARINRNASPVYYDANGDDANGDGTNDTQPSGWFRPVTNEQPVAE
jgi:hypothetical protein